MNLESGRGGGEKEWTDCVQSNIRGFGIAGVRKEVRKVTALEVWVETVTEGGRRFMAAWRKEEEDAARHRQEKREATRFGKLLCEATLIGLVDESKESLYGRETDRDLRSA